MNKRIWFSISMVLFVVLVVSLVIYLNCFYVFIEQKESNLQNYLNLSSENNFYFGSACIPDAQTAARIGSAIIDNMCDQKPIFFGFVNVEYDCANRLWKVSKSYLFSQGGFVIIDQDTGTIVRALLYK